MKSAFVSIEPADKPDSIRAKIERETATPNRYKIRHAALNLDKSTSLTVFSRLDRTQKDSCSLTVEFRKTLQNNTKES